MQTFNSIDGSAVGLNPANGSIWVMADVGIYPKIGAASFGWRAIHFPFAAGRESPATNSQP